MATHEDFYVLIRRIPAGKVATYGDVAAWVNSPDAAITVGTAVRNRPTTSDIPWWRVVAAGGRLSPGAPDDQRQRLEREGVTFTSVGKVDLRRHAWLGPST